MFIYAFIKISECFQLRFAYRVVASDSPDGRVTAFTVVVVLVGGVGKRIGCRNQLPALLHHFPNLRLLHLDLRANEQRDNIIQTELTRTLAMMSSSSSAISISKRLRLLRIIFRRASVSSHFGLNHIRLSFPVESVRLHRKCKKAGISAFSFCRKSVSSLRNGTIYSTQ